jgi:8-oxo-dGTP pyrophosphatase MutT (NUDIX family)
MDFMQYAALPYVSAGDRLLVCLVTSRETKRWIVPKGWAKAGTPGPLVAADEAFEEAGIVGNVGAQALGSYEYRKKLHVFAYATCRVTVYPLHADHQLRDWPERHQRRLAWLDPQEAARRVREADLAKMIIGFRDQMMAGFMTADFPVL